VEELPIPAAPIPAPAIPIATPVAVAPAPIAAAPMPSSDGGGSNFMDTVKSLNWLEVGAGVLGAVTMYFAIFYYRNKVFLERAIFNEQNNKIDQLSIKIADLEAAKEKEKQPTVSKSNGFNGLF
jgi:hypothetical protein